MQTTHTYLFSIDNMCASSANPVNSYLKHEKLDPENIVGSKVGNSN